MAGKRLTKSALTISAWLSLCLLAFGQGSVSIMDKLTKMEERINQLDAAQKKETKELQTQMSGLQSGGNSQGLQDSLKAIQLELASLQTQLATLKQDSSQVIELELLRSIAGDLQTMKSKSVDSTRQQPMTNRDAKPIVAEIKPGSPEAVTSKYKVKFYGFIKLEAIYDNSEVYQGDWLLYAYQSNSAQAKRQIFTMNARHSRINMKIDGPPVGKNGALSAFFEMDFSGGFPNSSTAARMPIMVMRHAWAELKYPRWETRFGQDWALISGPFPNTTSYVAGAGTGNLWMRMPQISFTWKPDPFKLAFSMNRPLSGNVKYNEYDNGDLDPVQDGERTGIPWFMARGWFKTKLATFSISGHVGREDVTDLKNVPHKQTSYSVNADAVISSGPIAATVRGFYGENLNTFFGGAIQGYSRSDSTSVTNIASKGGWGQIVYTFNDSWATTLGAGIDAPDKNDLTAGMRSQNGWGWANLAYTVSKAMCFMMEGEYLNTHYLGGKTGENVRMQFVSQYKF
jgi:hypothetical protein